MALGGNVGWRYLAGGYAASPRFDCWLGALMIGVRRSSIPRRPAPAASSTTIVDNVLAPDGLVAGVAALYANGRSFADPALSPVHAEAKGSADLAWDFRDRATCCSAGHDRHASSSKQAGVEADLHVYEGMSFRPSADVPVRPIRTKYFAELDAFPTPSGALKLYALSAAGRRRRGVRASASKRRFAGISKR